MRLLWAEMVQMKTLSVSLVCVGPKSAKNKTCQVNFCYRMFFFSNSLAIAALILTLFISIYLHVYIN